MVIQLGTLRKKSILVSGGFSGLPEIISHDDIRRYIADCFFTVILGVAYYFLLCDMH